VIILIGKDIQIIGTFQKYDAKKDTPLHKSITSPTEGYLINRDFNPEL
jgi:hypothetical protein